MDSDVVSVERHTQTRPAPGRAERNWSAERARLNDEARWGLSTAERFVLDAIEVHIAAHDEGWPTQGRLALQTGMSERQVRRVVEALVAAGFLRARVVPAGGTLPNGHRVHAARLVYARGRVRLPLYPSIAKAPPVMVEGAGHGVRISPTPAGRDVRGVPDMVSDEWKEKTKEQNTLSEIRRVDREQRNARESDFRSTEVTRTAESRPESNAGEVARILEYWRDVLWPDLRGVLESDDRARVITARLANGFTEHDLKRAVDAAKESPWHQAAGQAHRLRVSVLFGKSEMVADLVARGRSRGQQASTRREAASRAAPVTELACSPAENAASGQRVLAALARCLSSDGTARKVIQFPLGN